MTRLLVTGSRTWTDETLMANVLRSAWVRLAGHNDPITLVHGGAQGADLMADRIWRRVPDNPEPEVHRPDPADGRGAPFARNARMAASGISLCVAFGMPCNVKSCVRTDEFHITHGTEHCALCARREQVPVWLIGEWRSG